MYVRPQLQMLSGLCAHPRHADPKYLVCPGRSRSYGCTCSIYSLQLADVSASACICLQVRLCMLRCRFLVSVQGASVDHPALLKSKRLGRSSRAAMFKDSVDSQMFAAMLALTTSNYDTMTCWLRAPKLLVAHSRIAMPDPAQLSSGTLFGAQKLALCRG